MQVVVNAIVVGRSRGEKDVYIVENVNTGKQISLENNGTEIELGAEGEFIYFQEQVNKLINFEPAKVMEEEYV